MAPEPASARRNAVLNALDPRQLRALAADLEPVPLDLGEILHQPAGAVESVYFPIVGVVSVVAELDGDQTVEAASIGHEGMVGLSVFLDAGAPTERAVVQVPGQALRMSSGAFRRAAAVDGPLHPALRRYTQAMLTQLARNAACNRVHSVRQRAARWLLMTADRMDGLTFDLTQEFLAQMLAVRRASVSDAAQSLAEDHCITYTRGTITVLDRARLQDRACDCYTVIRQAAERSAQDHAPARAAPDLRGADPHPAEPERSRPPAR